MSHVPVVRGMTKEVSEQPGSITQLGGAFGCRKISVVKYPGYNRLVSIIDQLGKRISIFHNSTEMNFLLFKILIKALTKDRPTGTIDKMEAVKIHDQIYQVR